MNDFYRLKSEVKFDSFEFDPFQKNLFFIDFTMITYLNFSYVAFVAAVMLADASSAL